jgi:hypothetical protein
MGTFSVISGAREMDSGNTAGYGLSRTSGLCNIKREYPDTGSGSPTPSALSMRDSSGNQKDWRWERDNCGSQVRSRERG